MPDKSTVPLPLLIAGGRIIDPATNMDEIADLLLVEGRIAAIGRTDAIPANTQLIDARDLIVSPGFVDLHTHLRFPGFPQKETMRSGTSAAAAGGFTTVCAMANTNPVVDCVETLGAVHREIARAAQVRVMQLASVTLGLRGRHLTDMPALAAAGAVAFSDDGKPLGDGAIMRRALSWSANLGIPVSVHEEDSAIVDEGVANAGEPARRLGLAEWPCAGEASIVARDITLLEETGGHLHIAHVSCAETVPLIREGKRRGLKLTAEVTPHHLRLTDRLLNGDSRLCLPAGHPCTKVNPPLRSPEDVEAVIDALADGTIDAIATDHAPHHSEDKALPYAHAAFGLSAIETALPLALDLVRDGRISMATLIRRLTSGPAAIFGLKTGTLRRDAPADICVFDPGETWTVTPEALRSKGKNTPLMGTSLSGRVRYTVVGGRLVHPCQ
jgi:dihydroorotase